MFAIGGWFGRESVVELSGMRGGWVVMTEKI